MPLRLDSTAPTIWEFTDDEYAVILDSLTITRERLREAGDNTPILDEAIRKFTAWGNPKDCGFLAITGTDMQLIKDVIV